MLQLLHEYEIGGALRKEEYDIAVRIDDGTQLPVSDFLPADVYRPQGLHPTYVLERMDTGGACLS